MGDGRQEVKRLPEASTRRGAGLTIPPKEGGRGPLRRSLPRTPRQTRVANGVLQQDGDIYVLTQDYEFRSPSSAAAAMEGRTSNGRVEWHDKDGRTLKEIQAAAAGPGTLYAEQS